MTKSLTVEWAPDIRVNALASGYVKTAFTEEVRGNDDIWGEILEFIPQNRFATPRKTANTAVYLSSDATPFVTGEVHVVDGGMVVP
jgi:NAD(P)-dependent dehydrogenase (short-subunit alcohol dehydrogenase family)